MPDDKEKKQVKFKAVGCAGHRHEQEHEHEHEHGDEGVDDKEHDHHDHGNGNEHGKGHGHAETADRHGHRRAETADGHSDGHRRAETADGHSDGHRRAETADGHGHRRAETADGHGHRRAETADDHGHSDGDGHDHSGHDHSHGLGHHHSAISNLKLALVVNLAFSLIEVAGGIWSGSVAVLSSAIHDLSDALALAIAVVMEYAGNKTSNDKFTYGYRRLSLLSALMTCAVLVTAAMFVLARAVPLLLHPATPNLGGMAGFAVLGVAVNGFAALRLMRGGTMNERVASWHMIEDVLGWASVLIGSLVIRVVNLPIIDPLLSILVSLFILWGVLRNLQRTLRLFLQATPEGLDVKALRREIEGLDQVLGTHDAHLWSLDGESHVFTVHVVIAKEASSLVMTTIKNNIRKLVASKGKIHLTVELEEAGVDCPAVNCVED